MRKFKEDVREAIKPYNPPTPTVVSFVPIKFDAKKHKVMRPGKTAKDHKSGAHRRRLENQFKRAIASNKK
jgi:hypothetical protein